MANNDELIASAEVWRPISGNPHYCVSSHGRVRRDVGGMGCRSGRILKASPNMYGYASVNLSRFNSTRRHLVHRLVAFEFIPNPDNKPTVNHIDGDTMNNRVENLEWATNAEQTHHALRIGLMRGLSGAENPSAKLDRKSVSEIRVRAAQERRKDLAMEFGVCVQTIDRIVNFKIWTDAGLLAAVDEATK